MNNLSRMTLKYYYNFSIAWIEMNANRLKVRNNFHSFRMLCANWCRFNMIFFFTHCTIDCHITLQLVAANRYVYQYPRTARDKYVLVFREYEPYSVFLPDTSKTPMVRWFSRPCEATRRDAKRRGEKGSKMSSAWVMTVVARKYFASFIILGSVSSGHERCLHINTKHRVYKYINANAKGASYREKCLDGRDILLSPLLNAVFQIARERIYMQSALSEYA